MHSPAIPALIIFSIASTVLTTPLHTPGAADATTDVIALAEKRSEIATREAKGTKWPCIWHCDIGGICSCLEEREEAIVKREPAAVETRKEDWAPSHKPICLLCPPEEDEEEEVVTEKRAAAADDAIEEREGAIEQRAPGGKPICRHPGCPPEEDAAERAEALDVVKREREEVAVEREEDVVKRNEDILERQNLGCPICCCSDCYNGCFKEDVVEREENVTKWNETIVKRQNLGCPICCCSDCYNGCFKA